LTCRCNNDCGYIDQTPVNSGHVDSELECLQLCSEPSPLGVSKFWSYDTTVRLQRNDNCFCYSNDAVPTPQAGVNSGKVERKVCSCDNGVAVAGICTKINEQKCKLCKPGYDLIDQGLETICVEKQCRCRNGIGAQGKDCPQSLSWTCSACQIGYHEGTNQLAQNPVIPQELCVENQCKCKNGVAATGTDSDPDTCYENGTLKCLSCNKGYFLQNEKCMVNECTCPNGTGATGSECPVHAVQFCVKCSNGFHLQILGNGKSTGRCLPNDSEQEDILV
jgi:hypothetical protein